MMKESSNNDVTILSLKDIVVVKYRAIDLQPFKTVFNSYILFRTLLYVALPLRDGIV